MKKKLTGGEWLDHFQSKVRSYCEKQQIAIVHRVQMISILSKAWSKALEIGYMEKQNELDKANGLIRAQKEYMDFLYSWIDKRTEYLRVHGYDASIEEIKTGEELRKKIEEIES